LVKIVSQSRVAQRTFDLFPVNGYQALAALAGDNAGRPREACGVPFHGQSMGSRCLRRKNKAQLVKVLAHGRAAACSSPGK